MRARYNILWDLMPKAYLFGDQVIGFYHLILYLLLIWVLGGTPIL